MKVMVSKLSFFCGLCFATHPAGTEYVRITGYKCCVTATKLSRKSED